MRRLITTLLTATAVFAAHQAAHAEPAADGCADSQALAPFTDWAPDAFGMDTTAVPAGDGRLVVRLDNAQPDRLRLTHDAAGGEIALRVESGGSDHLAVDTTAFNRLLLRCVRFEGFGAEDEVFFDGIDAGFVARRWRIPHHSIGAAHAQSEAHREAVAHIERLTDHGALGAALEGWEKSESDGAALDLALRNTVAILVNATAYANTRSGAKVRGDSRHVLEVGGGILLRIRGRLIIVTASHIVPSRSPNRAVLALAHDGTAIPLRQLLHGGQRFDLAVFGFADPEQEADALKTYGGVRLADTSLAAHEFVFHIGFPDSWQTNEHAGPIQIGAVALPWVPRPIPVLTSGLVSEVNELTVRASARIAQGDSGGGFFTISPTGEPLLIGPTSTVRSREADGNPPEAEVAGPVTSGIFRLHVFDLPSLMPNYFAAASAGGPE